MIKFQENARTDGRMESRTEGQTFLIGLFRLPPGVQKVCKFGNFIKCVDVDTNVISFSNAPQRMFGKFILNKTPGR